MMSGRIARKKIVIGVSGRRARIAYDAHGFPVEIDVVGTELLVETVHRMYHCSLRALYALEADNLDKAKEEIRNAIKQPAITIETMAKEDTRVNAKLLVAKEGRYAEKENE